MGKSKQPSKFDPSNPESLRGLDEDTFIGIITRLLEQNRQISELLQAYIQERYASKSERFIDPGQLRLFGEAGKGADEQQNADASTGEEADEEPKPAKKKGSSRQRDLRSSNLKCVRIPVRKFSPEELVCPSCGQQLLKVNEKIVHFRYDYQPSSVCREEFVQDIFACMDCDQDLVLEAQLAGRTMELEFRKSDSTADEAVAAEIARLIGTLKSDDAPKTEPASQDPIDDAAKQVLADLRHAAARIARCEASAGMIAYIIVSKYCDHLPLYRLEQIFARQGADIASSTMCGWLDAAAEILRRIYERMQEKLLESKVVKTDDTPVKVLDRKTRRKIKLGRIWVYIGDADHPFILFHYTHGRGRAGPKYFLRGFKRYLQGDCFSGNEAICAENGAILVACNAHARRYFKKALLNYKAKSQEALRFFQQLFEIERVAKELQLSPVDVQRMREQEARPLMNSFKEWLDKEHLMALPKSAFGKAVSYCLNNWESLTAYLDDGDLSIDNNIAEQEMKRIAMGRKAWLFLGSDNGGERAEVLLSIISTCKLHGIEPWRYLKEVIETLTVNPEADIDQLLPNNWRPRSQRPTTEIPHVMVTPKAAVA